MSPTPTTGPRLRPFKPQPFGRYTLLLPLASGGMGEVFLAREEGGPADQALCVIKKMRPDLALDEGFAARFADEGRTLATLTHEAIARVRDSGVHEGVPFLAMEFVDGKDLRRVMTRMRDRKLPLPLSVTLSVVERALDALAAVHRLRSVEHGELGLVHRDVSPQNVLVGYDGEVKLIDFGLAKATAAESKTSPSVVLGKFLYMAPEQARHLPVDRRTDLYAAGLCLWELVAGRNPFEDVPQGELMARLAAPSIPPLQAVEPLCPPALSEAVARALAVDPAHRFQSAEDFRAALQAVLARVDPSAGREATARFMREAFAAEYQAERRMLATLRAQPRPPDRAPESQPTPVPSRPTPLAVPAVEVPQAPAGPRPGPEALSFLPTRKTGTSGKRPALRAPFEGDLETQPSIVVQPDLQEPPTRPNAAAPDQALTETAVPAVTDPGGLPSVVVADLEEVPAAAPASSTAVTTPEVQPRPATPPRPRRTGQRAKVDAAPRRAERAAAPPRPAPATPPERAESLQTRGGHMPQAKKSSGVGVWLVIPLLAVLAVGGYIAWDVYSEQLRAQQLEAEERERAAQEEPAPEERRREVVVPAAEPEEPMEPVPELKAKPVEVKKKATPSLQRPQAAGTPGEKAFRALKADFERLVDEGVQRRFKLQVNALGSEVAARGDDEAFVQKVLALHAQVQAALEKQQ